jgi:hypothetical protein
MVQAHERSLLEECATDCHAGRDCSTGQAPEKALGEEWIAGFGYSLNFVQARARNQNSGRGTGTSLDEIKRIAPEKSPTGCRSSRDPEVRQATQFRLARMSGPCYTDPAWKYSEVQAGMYASRNGCLELAHPLQGL